MKFYQNPEFLAEGTAINDLFKSDRVLIGGENTDTGTNVINQYLLFSFVLDTNASKNINANVWTLELAGIKQKLLAQRISSINSSLLCVNKVEHNVFELSKAIGMDKELGHIFKCFCWLWWENYLKKIY